jgi:glycogen synthase
LLAAERLGGLGLCCGVDVMWARWNSNRQPPNLPLVNQPDEGTGWTFSPATPEAMTDAVASAVRCWRQDKAEWGRVVARGMRSDHSWDDAALKYERVLLKLRKPSPARV